jgi:effector-binding domain-containing protein
MLDIKEKIEEIADTIEMKFDIEKFFPFEERIHKLFNKVKKHVNSNEASKNNRGVSKNKTSK